MDKALRQYVRERALYRCEYCRLRQCDETATPFHVEHVIAKQHNGADSAENLALACCWCNALKGPNLASIDPDTGTLTRLFHPRTDRWEEHFVREGPLILGISDIGRTTGWLLQFNSQTNVDQRTLLLMLGELD